MIKIRLIKVVLLVIILSIFGCTESGKLDYTNGKNIIENAEKINKGRYVSGKDNSKRERCIFSGDGASFIIDNIDFEFVGYCDDFKIGDTVIITKK